MTTRAFHSKRHHPGPGLKILNPNEVLWGGCYCGICGSRNDEELIPTAVRFYDPDDGWKTGILCQTCGEDAAPRGPRAGDYFIASRPGPDYSRADLQADAIDALAADGDLDAMHSESSDSLP